MNKHTGSCLCWKVRFSFEGKKVTVWTCHCSICRKWCWWPCMGIHMKNWNPSLEENKYLKWYDSSQWAMRWFCSHCGSNMFWSTKDKTMIIPFVGALDDHWDVEFTEEIFIDEKPWFYHFGNVTKKKTWAEVFAEFSGE